MVRAHFCEIHGRVGVQFGCAGALLRLIPGGHAIWGFFFFKQNLFIYLFLIRGFTRIE